MGMSQNDAVLLDIITVSAFLGGVFLMFRFLNWWIACRDRRKEQDFAESEVKKFLEGGGAEIMFNERFNGAVTRTEVLFDDSYACKQSFAWHRSREHLEAFIGKHAARTVRTEFSFNNNLLDMREIEPHAMMHFAET